MRPIPRLTNSFGCLAVVEAQHCVLLPTSDALTDMVIGWHVLFKFPIL